MADSSSSSEYTSFLPLTPEPKGITSGFSFSRIFEFPWKKNRQALLNQSLSEEKEDKQASTNLKDGQPETDNSKDFEKACGQSMQSNSTGTSLHPGAPSYGKSKSENSSPNMPRKEKGRYRNVKTILRRLSAIAVDKRWHQTSGDFKHDFKQYWMPDEHCKECYECGGKFNTFRRRHHCRVCGQIFCSRCCSQEVPGKTMGFAGHIRVCNYCYKIVKAYVEDDLDKSLQALNEDMKICYDEWNSSDPMGLHPSSSSLSSLRSSTASFPPRDDSGLFRVNSSNSLPGIIERDIISPLPVPRNPFDAFGVTPQEANDIKQDYLRDLWRQITDTNSRLELQSHRFRLKTYNNCFIGHELVDWLLTYGKAANRAQGVAIGQDLLDLSWIESIPTAEEDVFKDEYMLYQPGKLAIFDMELQGTLSGLSELEEATLKEENDDEVSTNVSEVDDDDETVPFWFRQISSETIETLTDHQEPHSNVETPVMARRFSSSRHLDLDQATIENGEGKPRAVPRELSLQMKLDYFSDDSENQVRKEIYDQTNKLSLITHVPPPPLDTYVCVEGHPFATKKRISKIASSSHLPDDVLRGIVEFPKPSAAHEGSQRELKDESCEGIARDRLQFASSHHLVALLKQLIEQDGLSSEWKDIIMPIVTRISEKVVPDVRRDDDMDIRRYVWFKKVPVGDIPECQVVYGVVFTKNVVHKKMNCNFTQPRILMLSCAIEYQRVENKLTSIDPVVLQEYEFLKNFTARIVTLKPNIVLVEKTVARVAQDMLRAAGITLVHNIKSNVMENISRCTGADILQSIEQFSRPRLGSCQHFKLQKYNLSDGETKTLMFFEGCAPDLGCSLVLQGADKNTLAKVKNIIKYLIYVAYHLKLENKFLMDEFALPPNVDHLVPRKASRSGKSRRAVFRISEEDDLEEVEEEQSKLEEYQADGKSSKTKQENILEEFKKFSELLSRVILSSSPFCVYPLPYLLTEEGQTCSCRRFIPDQLYESRLLRADEADLGPNVSPNPEKLPAEPKVKALHPNIILNEPHPFTRPDVVPRLQDHDVKCLLADFRARGGLVDLKTCRHFEELQHLRRKEVNIKKRNKLETIMNARSQIEDAKDQENKINEKYVGFTEERDKKMDCFDPYNHQRIAVLFSSYCAESHNAPKPCISPWAVFMEFYGRNDITLGGFLERYCFRPSYICFSHNCDVPMVNHIRYFAHGNGSLYIHMRNLDSPIPGYDRTILTWSWCRSCKQVTPVVPLSFESWSLSFAKYLELRFYGGQYTRRASAEPCGHSLHHDHHQYFTFANMVASFKYRSIELYEVIIPTAEVVIGKEREPNEWADDVEEFCNKTDQVLMQIVERINDLKTVDPFINLTRDQKIKDFQVEFQAESYHFNEFIQCLKMKVDSLLSFRRHEISEDQPPSSQSTESTDGVISLKLNPSEVSALMTGIGNMLIKLKAQLCVIVHNWNSKLQEFIQLEKKREKNTKLSSSPKSEDFRYHPSNTANDVGEMCIPVSSVDLHDDDSSGIIEAAKYTYVHTPTAIDKQKSESVSEVHLTNGTILRQTFLGTQPPKNYGIYKRDDEAEKKEDSNVIEDVNNQKENMKLDLKKPEAVDEPLGENGPIVDQKDQTGDDENRVSSPYMVIRSPVFGSEVSVLRKVSSDNKEQEKSLTSEGSSSRKSSVSMRQKKNSMTRTGSIQVEQGSVSENDNNEPVKSSIQSIAERVESPESNQSYTGQEHWMAESRERSDTVINTMDFSEVPKHLTQREILARNFDDAASHHSSLFVEDNSDVDLADLMSLQDVLEFADDDRSYLSDGDADSDVDNNDNASDIGLGESAVDYESFVKLFKEDAEETIKEKANIKGALSVNVSFDSSDSNSGGEKTKLEDYFTPDSTKIDEKIVKESPDENAQQTALRDTTESKTQMIEKSETTQKIIEDGKNKPDTDFVSKLGEQLTSEVVSDTLKDSDMSSDQSSRISFADDHFDGEIERILKSNARRTLFERLDAHSGSLYPKNQTKTTIGDSTDEMHTENENIQFSNGVTGLPKEKNSDSALYSPANRDSLVRTAKRTSFSEGRVLGHRRMQSAPVPLTECSPLQRSKSVVEEALPGSPFELVKTSIPQEQNLSRIRSLSHGDHADFVKGQEELNKIAEKICQVDRKDLEMDDPEEIQYDESVSEDVTVADVGSKGGSIAEKKSKDGSEVFDTESEKGKKKDKTKVSKGTSEADESEKESTSSASFTAKAKGHVRQKSLPYRAFGLMDSKEDGEISKSNALEASNNVTGQKKGSEKMKKIISHLLPSSNFQPVPSPFPPHEHYLLPPGDSVSVVVNEKEPTSIIAYSLSSAEYNDKLNALQLLMAGGDETDSQVSTKLSSSPVKKEMESTETNANGVILRRRKTEMADTKRPRSWAGMPLKSALVEYPIIPEADSKTGLETAKSQYNSKEALSSAQNRTSLADQYLISSAKFSENSKDPSEFLIETQTAVGSDGQITDSLEGLLDDKDDLDSNLDGIKSEPQDEKFGKKKPDSKPSIDYNIILQFQDNTAKFYCNVYYAEQFRQLRELIFPEGEERYIQSLSRCVFWKARGGKSGSSFSKSLDDRFVMKQMSRLEAQSFRDFAPQYFLYMDRALKEQRPTTLAKIFGVYRIGFKNSQTNTTMRQDVLVMENLFYNLKVNKIFDLKGSVRSRYVNTSQGKEDVLMDENLLEMICESPLFIRPHSKAVLSKAIHNDSEFLSNHSVMDYSLLVGIDEVNFELVVGIIDYIRTYTWDKKLESYVKSTGILGGQGKMPTVVSPAVYRTRFTEAMHRYFLMVPDKWTGFGADLK